MLKKLLLATTISLAFLASTSALSASYDFSTLSSGTNVTNQYAGTTFSLAGGGTTSGSPTVNHGGITNSTTGAYPTADQLVVDFDYAVENVSFNFNNLGNNASFGGTIWSAYDASNTLLGSGSLSSASGELFSLGLAGITSIIWDNNLTGRSSWIFSLKSLSFDASVTPVPVPAALFMFVPAILGFFGFRRKLQA